MSMEKYGVVTDHAMEKTAKSSDGLGCPRCGTKAVVYSGVLMCPTCGTAPFESEVPKKDSHVPPPHKK